MTKLDAALLKLEGTLDYTIDPRVRHRGSQALGGETPQEVYVTNVACMRKYQRAA